MARGVQEMVDEVVEKEKGWEEGWGGSEVCEVLVPASSMETIYSNMYFTKKSIILKIFTQAIVPLPLP